jgi:Transposase DDE domain
MQSKYDILQENEQDPQKASQEIAQELELFLTPLLIRLDTLLDKRLLRTLVQCCVAIIRFRNHKQGLLLSELGSYMDGYRGVSKKATAGTKRVGSLIRFIKWGIFHIDTYLLEEADKEVQRLKELGKRILCLWDGSVIEKPESSTAEGLCPVVSSKAKRLNRSRKGHVFNMPAVRPVMVTGMHWTGALIAGLEGIPKIALMSWWTTRGDYATKAREQEEEMLRKCVRKWGILLVHVFDRGYASGPWIQLLQTLEVKFVIRWIKKHKFFDSKGVEKKLWEIGRGKKYLGHKEIFDVATGQKMPCDIWWTQVWHASYAYPLYCVKVRVKQKVWYLITNEPIKTEVQAWEIVFIYKRRWQIETSFRYGKCELAMESPRLWAFENRLKLLSIVTLVYAFLIHILEPVYRELVQSILRLKCHRTGKRCRDILTPLYRVRWAISRLWDEYHPMLGSVFPPNLETLQVLASFRC